MGNIDEMSKELGKLAANTENLGKLFDRHCDDDNRMHKENQDILYSIKTELGDIRDTIGPVAQTVKRISPIVEELQISRWRFAGGVTLATVLLGAVGWFVTSFVAAFFNWLMPHIK